jgi:hypothetical protein
MLVNYFLAKNVEYNHIRNYSNLCMFLISVLSIYWSIFGFSNYNKVFLIYFGYFITDFLFLPWQKKKDIILHHFIIVFFLVYALNSTKEFHLQVTSILIRCEVSSLFLACMETKFLYTNTQTKMFLFLNYFCFLISFLVFRILNLTKGFIFDKNTWKYIEEKNKNNIILNYIISFFIFSFLFLNYFWLWKIISTIRNKYILQKKKNKK